MSPPDQIVLPAATIILLRDVADGPPEIFMVERARTMRFAAGAMVFPGGKVDAHDHDIARDDRLAPGFAAFDADDAAARVAAIRETFEEAGVLVTDGPALSAADRAHLRPRVAAGELAFGDFLRDVGHQLQAEVLTPFARWAPPSDVTHRRFDTRFYLARMPAGEEALHDGSETTQSHWVSARGALDLADRGQSSVIFPTRRNLERLALHDSIDALIAATRAIPVRLIVPHHAERDGQMHLCLPDDCGYPVTSELLESAMRG